MLRYRDVEEVEIWRDERKREIRSDGGESENWGGKEGGEREMDFKRERKI